MLGHRVEALYIFTDDGHIHPSTCEHCTDKLIEIYRGEGNPMGDKVVKMPDELYQKVKAKADTEGISMAKALDALAEGEPIPENIEAFIPSCAKELGVKMPTDYRWIKPLTKVLPSGLRGKLEPYAKVLECAEAKAEVSVETGAEHKIRWGKWLI